MAGIFKAYDVRGRYPDEIDEKTAFKLGSAFIQLLKVTNIVVGHDMRTSSPSLAKAFIDGAVGSGARVTDIGMVTTPLLYFAIIEGAFEAGACITASHLGAAFNGFKLCREKAIPLTGDGELTELEKMVNEGRASTNGGSPAGSCEERTFLPVYIEKMKTFVHNPKDLRMVVDAGNGIAGPEVIGLVELFPAWHMTALYMEPDGAFPHHVANPLIEENTRDLRSKVVTERADLGVAFDGDADRCGFVDEKGTRVPEDLVTALISQFFLAQNPGAVILYDLRSSRIVPETITRLGGKAIRCRVGHAFIKAQMRQENAFFAGELSGHYYYRDTGFTDNALFTMIQMLNLLSLKKQSLSGLIEPLKKYSATGEMNFTVTAKGEIYAALERQFKGGRQDHLDGLSIDYDDWWFNIRASNTEPLMRLNLEAESPGLMESKREEVMEIIQRADPGMKIKA